MTYTVFFTEEQLKKLEAISLAMIVGAQQLNEPKTVELWQGIVKQIRLAVE